MVPSLCTRQTVVQVATWSKFFLQIFLQLQDHQCGVVLQCGQCKCVEYAANDAQGIVQCAEELDCAELQCDVENVPVCRVHSVQFPGNCKSEREKAKGLSLFGRHMELTTHESASNHQR